MNISTTPMNLSEVTLLYTPPGVGKTEMAAHYPDPLFLMVGIETGLLTLIKHGRVPANTPKIDQLLDTWDKLQQALDLVEKTGKQFGTLVIDTLNACQYLLKSFVTETEFENDPAQFDSYGKGWARMYDPWKFFLGRLDWIRRNQGLRILLLAHSSVNRIGNPDGDDYQSNSPELNEKWIWNQTNAWADNVLFGNLEVVAVKKKGDSKAKGQKGDRRVLYVHSTASHFAKNRWGLRSTVSMGNCGKDAYQNLLAAIKSAQSPAKPKAEEKPKQEAPAPETKPQEPATSLTGDDWTVPWLKRFAAAKRIGIISGLFSDMEKAYDTAPEDHRINDFPGLLNAWVRRAVEVTKGDVKQLVIIRQSLEGRPDMPVTKALELIAEVES